MAFRDAYARARQVPGWLTEAQARVLHEAASMVPKDGRVVEIGSHHGRSTLVLADALSPGTLVAVDPFPVDWRYGAPGTEAALRHNLAAAGAADVVELRVATSREVRESWTEPVDLVYVDGKHDHWTAYDDLRWAEHLAAGGSLLLHDAFSSLGVTTALLRATLRPGTALRYRRRTGSLATLDVGRPGHADRARVLAELPWFARNLVVKVALRLRLFRVAGALGHEGLDDPF
jgi:predicted O-methyltransferase YrrM